MRGRNQVAQQGVAIRPVFEAQRQRRVDRDAVGVLRERLAQRGIGSSAGDSTGRPVDRATACSSALTLWVQAGAFNTPVSAHAAGGSSCACTSARAAAGADVSHSGASGGIGQRAGRPSCNAAINSPRNSAQPALRRSSAGAARARRPDHGASPLPAVTRPPEQSARPGLPAAREQALPCNRLQSCWPTRSSAATTAIGRRQTGRAGCRTAQVTASNDQRRHCPRHETPSRWPCHDGLQQPRAPQIGAHVFDARLHEKPRRMAPIDRDHAAHRCRHRVAACQHPARHDRPEQRLSQHPGSADHDHLHQSRSDRERKNATTLTPTPLRSRGRGEVRSTSKGAVARPSRTALTRTGRRLPRQFALRPRSSENTSSETSSRAPKPP